MKRDERLQEFIPTIEEWIRNYEIDDSTSEAAEQYLLDVSERIASKMVDRFIDLEEINVEISLEYELDYFDKIINQLLQERQHVLKKILDQDTLTSVSTFIEANNFDIALENAMASKRQGDPTFGVVFFTVKGNNIVCCDNTTGDAWVESFELSDWQYAKAWLQGNISYDQYYHFKQSELEFRYKPYLYNNTNNYYTLYELNYKGRLLLTGVLALDRNQEGEDYRYSDEGIKKIIWERLPSLSSKPNVHDYGKIIDTLVNELYFSDEGMLFVEIKDFKELVSDKELTIEDFKEFNQAVKQLNLENVIEGLLPESQEELDMLFSESDDTDEILTCYTDLTTIFNFELNEVEGQKDINWVLNKVEDIDYLGNLDKLVKKDVVPPIHHEILQEFKGVIDGHNVDNQSVYWGVVYLIENFEEISGRQPDSEIVRLFIDEYYDEYHTNLSINEYEEEWLRNMEIALEEHNDLLFTKIPYEETTIKDILYQHQEKDLDNDGVSDRIDVDDSRNEVQTVSDLEEVGNNTQKPSQLAAMKAKGTHSEKAVGDKPLEQDLDR